MNESNAEPNLPLPDNCHFRFPHATGGMVTDSFNINVL